MTDEAVDGLDGFSKPTGRTRPSVIPATAAAAAAAGRGLRDRSRCCLQHLPRHSTCPIDLVVPFDTIHRLRLSAYTLLRQPSPARLASKIRRSQRLGLL
jgi:hypothetical protein